MRYVLIADDHEVTRRGIRDLLNEAFEEVEISEVVDGAQLLSRLGDRPWNLVLLDVMMPGSNVVDLVSEIRAALPLVPILILTAATEVEYAIQTMKAGATGFVRKHRAADVLLEAIRRVEKGQPYLHPETAIEVAAALREREAQVAHQSLSDRELEIFRQIALGRAVKEIAADLSISDKTVATYLARIREKTGLQSAVDIARYALKSGLVD